ncbi:DUF5686 family protein [Robiginitalea sp.]|uniref:DUF5686 family protein n=1 Tax=Robiginitalea sp. TaxID=1902411 RepID=UPI003C724F25
MQRLLAVLVFWISAFGLAQTKVGGVVVDELGDPVAFANVLFKNSTEGTISNEDGRFYLESQNRFDTLVVSFVGYASRELVLSSRATLNMEIVLVEGEQLDEVVVFMGKQSKKNNPAIDILRKIWAKKRSNGLRLYDQYRYDEYEKIEFDLNTIDSALMQSKLFRGMEFVFDDLDTSRITGKTYLPVFINEKFTTVYGDNEMNLDKRVVMGNKNSGFSNNQAIIAFVQDLYTQYDVYDNYIKLFDKSFTSPLSKTGIDTYNYVLADSAYIKDKWCYNIIYYPRRKNELTFKGDFWVNDTTYAIAEINMQVTRSANVNWVKELYIEQEFEVLSDSVFLLKRDYLLTDFALNKKDKSRGVYGKRTTVYDNYIFDQAQPKDFYQQKQDPFNPVVMERSDAFWENNRLEDLNRDEEGIYAMLDTLKTVPKFNTFYYLASVLGSGYIEIDKWNIDLGDIYSAWGYNDAEGVRFRGGVRTFFGQNDPWRIQAYGAYGFMDRRIKYGISGKVLLDRRNRLILSGGNRRDIEQLGLNLTATTDVLGRSIASGNLLTVGTNDRLTNINLSTLMLEMEPVKNLRMRFGTSYRTLKSALPEAFSLDYLDPDAPGGVSSQIRQFDLITTLVYTPGKRTIGYGVERRDINDDYSTLLINYTHGVRGFFESDFDYRKIQFSYTQPWQLGGLGRLTTSVEVGKTFGAVPLGLLNVVPGNQTFFTIFNSFPNLDFYEFVTDTYTSMHLEHNFNGRILSRIPLLRDLNLREIVGLRGVWGELSEENRVLSSPTNIPLQAPDDRIYWEYSFGVGNIFKIFRIDFNFRGNYLESPEARPFSVTGTFGFQF